MKALIILVAAFGILLTLYQIIEPPKGLVSLAQAQGTTYKKGSQYKDNIEPIYVDGKPIHQHFVFRFQYKDGLDCVAIPIRNSLTCNWAALNKDN